MNALYSAIMLKPLLFLTGEIKIAKKHFEAALKKVKSSVSRKVRNICSHVLISYEGDTKYDRRESKRICIKLFSIAESSIYSKKTNSAINQLNWAVATVGQPSLTCLFPDILNCDSQHL